MYGLVGNDSEEAGKPLESFQQRGVQYLLHTPPSFHLVVHLLCISPQILWFLLFYLHHINNFHIFIKVGGHDATGLLCLIGLTSALSAVRLSPSVRARSVQPDAREQASLLKR